MDAVIGQELHKLNNHLPKQRLTLTELLKKENPTAESMDGSSIVFKKSELEELASLVPSEYHDRIRLPIIVLRRMELGKSVYTVAGNPTEEFLVKKLLGMTSEEYHRRLRQEEPPAYLYRSQIVELIRRFHSLVVMGFGVPKELTDHGPSRD
jgi:uncharacterized protein (UPF0216 family)